MSEWALLGLVAVVLYVVECLGWVEAAAVVVFRAPVLGRWRCGQGETLPGNTRGGLVLLDPLVLDGSVVLCHRWPLSLSPDGVTNAAIDGGVPLPADPQYIPFDEIQTIREECGEIKINGTRVARVNSSVLA